jgi:hypothetical protein
MIGRSMPLAEIADKVPDLVAALAIGIAFGVQVYVLARTRWRMLAWLDIAFFAFVTWGFFKDLYLDRIMRDSILSELGAGYMISILTATSLPVLIGFAGLLKGSKADDASRKLRRIGRP